MHPDQDAPSGDAGDLKATVRELWVQKSDAWDRWADDISELAERLNAPLLDAADLAPGQAVLDLASGVGEPALSIARRVGDTGMVTATDLVPEMLAGAKRRATAAGLANLRFEIADMEDLPFGDGAFDRVVCRFGLMFCPRADTALAEARRVLKAGGRAAFLVWGPIEDNTLFDVIQTVAAGFVDTPPFVGDLTPFRFGADGGIARALEDAGFGDVEERAIRFTPGPPAGSRFWQFNLEMSFGTVLEQLSPARREAFDAALDGAFASHLDGDVYRLAAHVRVGTGIAPGLP
jgi:ubiquinone/menaquinone biosynthesis C-methylase UbiE